MNTPSTPPDRNQLSRNLVQELLDMRDALVTLSLTLKDWQFELDQQGRKAAQKEADAMLNPMRLKPQPQPQPQEDLMHIKSPRNSSPG
ncbi:hypothetical protein DIC66_06950 [Rhodoferax lacus]|uniref:Uncharacterized protein n=1 Tax=Rhodoferax lacus TaxID=2184758 RepID=A0A3E1RDZ5_9BURK|nr:hypothetical protein [Rhodoferax lacus]RFO97596.1 hypothetical protein DIC66_06950 [Rhodoferax lacus]